jgi:tRNA (adenine22-N1)-methyltransferase
MLKKSMLSKRLKSLGELILHYLPESRKVIDIGCDHALLGEYLGMREDNVEYIGIDRSKPALERTKSYYKKQYTYIPSGFLINTSNVKLLHQTGQSLQSEKSLILIAGMGGEEIIKIMRESVTKDCIFILSAHKNVNKLRKFLADSGYKLIDETVIFDKNHYYETLIVSKNATEPIHPWGSKLWESHDSQDYLKHLISREKPYIAYTGNAKYLKFLESFLC